MVEETTTVSDGSSSEEPLTIEAILVPPNINMDIYANVGQVIYDKINLSNLNGNLTIDDRSVLLQEVVAKGLGGTIKMSGSYDTKVRTEPAFNIKYDLSNLDFQRTFNAVNTFEKMAPIAKFINGAFSTSLIMDGKIGENLMPKYSSLNAKGFLETINGVVSGLKPLEVIGNSLDIKELKGETVLAKTRNWFEMKGGKVFVDPFDLKLSGIDMNIVGNFDLNQVLDYQIKAKVPKAKLGNAANKGLNLLEGKAKQLGIPIKEAEFVNVSINLKGALTDPKIGLNLLGTDGTSSVTEAAKEVVKNKVEETKDEVVDSVKTVVEETVDEVTEEAKDKAKDIIKDNLGSSIDSIIGTEIIDSSHKEEIKNALDKFNPFKKKKKKKKN